MSDIIPSLLSFRMFHFFFLMMAASENYDDPDIYSRRVIADYQTDYEYSDFEESSYYEYSDDDQESSYDEVMANNHLKFTHKNDSDDEEDQNQQLKDENVYYYEDYFPDDLERQDMIDRQKSFTINS